MYIIDVTHYLNDKGAIALQKGPARRFAEFVGAVVAAAMHPRREVVAPGCFKCRKAPVQPDVARDGAVVWSCRRCATEGRISNWRGSLWDLGQPEPPPH